MDEATSLLPLEWRPHEPILALVGKLEILADCRVEARIGERHIGIEVFKRIEIEVPVGKVPNCGPLKAARSAVSCMLLLGARRLRRHTCGRNGDSQRVSCYPPGRTVGRRDRPRIGALCPFVRLVSGVGDHITGDRPRPDPVWETACFSVTPAPTAVLGAVPCFRRPL